MDVLRQLVVGLTIALLAGWSASANPIPWPVPASMPLEDMYSELLEIDGDTGLREHFRGDYYFSRIPEDLYLMKYPVPPGSENIRVYFGKLQDDWQFDPAAFPYMHETLPQLAEQRWFYIRELYPTVVPGWPGIPMIAWRGPFDDTESEDEDDIPTPPSFPPTALYQAQYEYNLRRWHNGWLYFYALGTGKYYSTYQKEAISFLDITMPRHLNMARLFLDYTPHPFAFTQEGEKTVVSIYAATQFGPFTRDIIGVIYPCFVRADVTYSDNVDIVDIVAVRNQLGKQPEYVEAESADVNADGQVDLLDLIAVRNRLGQDADAVAAPVETSAPQIRLRYQVKNCIGGNPSIAPDVQPWNRRMIVTDTICFNCCAEYVRMTILVDGDRVIFREKAVEEAPCDCLCYYPMRGVAGPFAPGVYQVELIDPHGNTILQKEIEIE